MDAPLWQSVVASLPIAVCILDVEARVLSGNRALERVLGRPIAKLCGLPLSWLLQEAISDPAHALSWSVTLSQTISTGETSCITLPAPFTVGPERRQRCYLVGVAAPWIGEANERLGSLLLFMELSALDQVAPQRDHFLSAVYHELGLPTTSILAAAEQLASRAEQGDRTVRKLVQIIVTEAARLRRLLAQSLAQQGPPRTTLPERQPVALGPLIGEVIETSQLRQSTHPLVVDLPPDLPSVSAEPDRVSQALDKLVDNAIKYSPAGTRIVVAARANETDVLTTVFDEGPTIQEDEALRLFEPSFRGKASQAIVGRGLGLPLARSLVRAMGGELWYETPLYGGNRFCFSLPRSSSIHAETLP